MEQKLILKAKPDATITIDVQPKLGSKPDKGSFIVEVKGKKIVNLVAIARPFEKVHPSQRTFQPSVRHHTPRDALHVNTALR